MPIQYWRTMKRRIRILFSKCDDNVIGVRLISFAFISIGTIRPYNTVRTHLNIILSGCGTGGRQDENTILYRSLGNRNRTKHNNVVIYTTLNGLRTTLPIK